MATDVLLQDAWTPGDGQAILANVMKYNPCNSGHKGLTLVFPECGSGYHEWEIVHVMIEAGHDIVRVVLMDSTIDPRWVAAWRSLSESHGTELVVLDSYVALEKWACSLHLLHEALPDATRRTVRVLYVNGAIRFGEFACNAPPEAARRSAVKFWEWCDVFSINRVPFNYVGSSALRPALSETWMDMATKFNTQ